ncbi:MAG: methyltransferase [Desulfotomaculaceae bacterium]|nr:methyltransferase [Desulfotomaculaceae bacterium]MDD4767599.1 methyltransferase [Desulfotomaculaceae bacterium]
MQGLSEKLDTDYRALWTVTEALEALGYVTYSDNNQIKLSDEAENIFYNPAHRDYTGFSFMHGYNLITSWIQLPDVIKTGKPAPRKDKGNHSKDFIRAMSHHAQRSAAQIAEYCMRGLPAGQRVLDVGGGPLTYAYSFAKNGAAVTVLDLPEVIDMMRPELDKAMPVKMVKGDFTEGLPEGPYDLVYLGNVCHIYGEKENRKLFTDAAKETVKGGRLVISDMIRGTGVRPAVFAVNMLVNTVSGGTWTYEQYKEWLEDAGFKVCPWEEVGGIQLISGYTLPL